MSIKDEEEKEKTMLDCSRNGNLARRMNKSILKVLCLSFSQLKLYFLPSYEWKWKLTLICETCGNLLSVETNGVNQECISSSTFLFLIVVPQTFIHSPSPFKSYNPFFYIYNFFLSLRLLSNNFLFHFPTFSYEFDFIMLYVLCRCVLLIFIAFILLFFSFFSLFYFSFNAFH